MSLDFDAVETPMLVDATCQGQPRKLLMQANRNGFFYVIDRTNGKLLLAKPFVNLVTWAKGFDENGRPILNPNQTPNREGVRVCPAKSGASSTTIPSSPAKPPPRARPKPPPPRPALPDGSLQRLQIQYHLFV